MNCSTLSTCSTWDTIAPSRLSTTPRSSGSLNVRTLTPTCTLTMPMAPCAIPLCASLLVALQDDEEDYELRPVSSEDSDVSGTRHRFFRMYRRTSDGPSVITSPRDKLDKSERRKWSFSRSSRHRGSKRNSGVDISGPIGCVHVRSSNPGQLPRWLQLHLNREEAEAKLATSSPGSFVIRQSRYADNQPEFSTLHSRSHVVMPTMADPLCVG
jgi:hypothetical protein